MSEDSSAEEGRGIKRRTVMETAALVGLPLAAIDEVEAKDLRTSGPGATRSGEIIIGLPDHTADLESAARDRAPAGSEVVKVNERINTALVKLPESADTAAGVDSIDARDDVRYAEENGIATADDLSYQPLSDGIDDLDSFEPNDPLYDRQAAPEMVNAPDAWEETLGSSDVTIAICDSGTKYDHEDLEANMDDSVSNHGYDFVDNNTDPYPENFDADDPEAHGTQVSGIAGAVTDNDVGVAGISDCSLLAVRVLGPDGFGSHDDIADGITWAADHGADIINLSLGGEGESRIYDDAISYADSQGALTIGSAGNDGEELEEYGPGSQCHLAISAADTDEELASFSNWGDYVDLIAPGTSGATTHPADFDEGGPADEYSTFFGTSMSAPVVAGIAGLVLSKEPGLSVDELVDRLKSTARNIGLSEKEQGAGMADASLAVFNAGVVSGTVEEPDGTPSPDDLMYIWYKEGEATGEIEATEGDGTFEFTSLKPDLTYDLGCYRDFLEGPRDGIVDMYAVERVTPDEEIDLGTVTVPSGDVVDVQIVDAVGEPVEEAIIILRHVNDETGAETGLELETAEDGYIWYGDDGEKRGIELTGTIEIEITPPEEQERFLDETYHDQFEITEDVELSFALEETFGVDTGEATDVGPGSARLHGEMRALGDAESATSYVSYWEAGAYDETEKVVQVEELSAPGTFSHEVSGLDAETEYVFQAYAQSDDGEWVNGTEATFTTGESTFAVATGEAGDVSATSATLHGEIVDLGGANGATVYFSYWEAGAYDETEEVVQVEELSALGTFSEQVGGLDEETEYVFQAYAESDGEWVNGAEAAFTTGEPEAEFAVATGEAGDVGVETATFQGELVGLGDAESATVYFSYWEAGAYDETEEVVQVEELAEAGSFSYEVGGLDAETEYVFQAYAESDGEWVNGAEATFTTGEPEVEFAVATGEADDVGADSATLEGELVGLGDAESATMYFSYWEAGAYDETEEVVRVEELSSPGTFSEQVGGLDAETEYVFQAYAESDGEWVNGAEAAFTTGEPEAEFAVATGEAGDVGASSATLQGELTGVGDAESATMYFSYWEAGAYDETEEVVQVEELSEPGTFSYEVDGLDAGTEYVFQAYAESDGKWVNGAEAAFTTE